MKLSPFFTATANVAARLDGEGADALVLFNRFYQPDIDLKSLSPVPSVVLSTSSDNRLPMRWIAILYGRLRASLAATGGIYTAEDALKMVLAGADVTMLCATLLKSRFPYRSTPHLRFDHAQYPHHRQRPGPRT